MTTRALKQTSRSCVTCRRTLPKRAYRKQCASCIKEDNGYTRWLEGVTRGGKRLLILRWFRPVKAHGAA